MSHDIKFPVSFSLVLLCILSEVPFFICVIYWKIRSFKVKQCHCVPFKVVSTVTIIFCTSTNVFSCVLNMIKRVKMSLTCRQPTMWIREHLIKTIVSLQIISILLLSFLLPEFGNRIDEISNRIENYVINLTHWKTVICLLKFWHVHLGFNSKTKSACLQLIETSIYFWRGNQLGNMIDNVGNRMESFGNRIENKYYKDKFTMKCNIFAIFALQFNFIEFQG